MIQLIESSFAADRLDAAAAFITSVPPATEVLIVGASRDAADDLARRVTVSKGVTFGLHRASLTQLAARFAAAEMARHGVAAATTLGTEAIAARATFEALRDAALPYFAPVARFPGFARALASTLAELRLSNVDARRIDGLGEAAHDVVELLRRFEEQLRSGAVSDRADLLKLATESATAGALDAVRSMAMVFLDVAIELPVERGFVEAVTAVSPAVVFTVPAGDPRTLESVRDLGAHRRAVGADSADSDLERARRYLFSEASPPAGPARGDVIFFSAPGEGRESVEIARRILEHAREGMPFDEIAVLLRAPEVYGSLLEVAFTRAGIPAYFARGSQRPDPGGRAFLALLDSALEGLSAKKFAEYLSLGQVPPLDPAGAPPTDRAMWVAPEEEAFGPAARAIVAPDDEESQREAPQESPDDDADDRPVVEGTLRAPWRWEELLVESAVIGGRERWSRRLTGLGNEFRAQLAEISGEEPDSPRVRAIERDAANLEHLRRFALPVVERLASLPTTATWTWGEWLPALEALAPMVLRRPERVLTVLAELRPLGVVGPVPLAEVRDVLAEQLANLPARPPDHRYGRVFVGTITDARGRSFEIVFAPGLAERIFPRKPREDPMLLDALRKRIDERLTTQDDRSDHERLLLRLVAGAASRRLYLSYSRLELAEARPRVPSFYALEVARALTGDVPDPEEMAREAEGRGDARLAWPAPDDASRAIDEVEHDLATLGMLLKTPEAQGRARYLLELSDSLARSLRTQWSRWSRKAWNRYDGIVRVADGTRDALAAARLGARAYSVSALQKFATCPYQFFLSSICRLEPRREIASIVELDPLTRGHIYHEVLAELMRELGSAGQLPLSPASRDVAQATLDRVLDRVAREAHEQLAPAIQRVWQDEIEAMRADLRMCLARSLQTQPEWEPIAFELAFGLRPKPEFDPRSVAAEVVLPGGFRLRGIIDVVERRRDGALRVTDYKTGRNWTKARMVIGGGEVLQPVLYGLAVEDVLGGHVVESRLFYCTRAGRFDERMVSMSSDARQRGVDVLAIVDRAVERGFLPPAPRRHACGICDFRDVCGPSEEQRLELKDRVALEDLSTLRDWP